MNVIQSIWNTWEQASKLFEKTVENAPTTLDPKDFLEYQIRLSHFVKDAAALSMEFSNKVLDQVLGKEKVEEKEDPAEAAAEAEYAEWVKGLSLNQCLSVFSTLTKPKTPNDPD